MVTIHYQMAYQIQNHSLDIATPKNTNDIIFLNVTLTENHTALWSQSKCLKTYWKNSFPKSGMLPINSFNLPVFQLLSYYSQLIQHFIDPQVEDYLFPLHLHKMLVATQLYVFILNFLIKKCRMKSNQRSMVLLLKGKPYIFSSLVIPTLLIIDAFRVQSNLIPIIPQISLDYLDANNNRFQSQKDLLKILFGKDIKQAFQDMIYLVMFLESMISWFIMVKEILQLKSLNYLLQDGSHLIILILLTLTKIQGHSINLLFVDPQQKAIPVFTASKPKPKRQPSISL